jgi:hypothetical protein
MKNLDCLRNSTLRVTKEVRNDRLKIVFCCSNRSISLQKHFLLFCQSDSLPTEYGLEFDLSVLKHSFVLVEITIFRQNRKLGWRLQNAVVTREAEGV